MDMMEALRTAIKEWVVPELDKIRLENGEIRATLQLTNKRLDDIQAQLIDQSRRIDETNKRIDKVHDDLLARIDKVHGDLLARVDKVHGDLLARVDKVHGDLLARIDETNGRLNRLYEVIVRREEHQGVIIELQDLKRRVEQIEHRLAA